MVEKDIVDLILQNLFSFDEYSRAVIPHLKEEYFQNTDEREVFKAINSYVDKYNELPGRDVVLIELDNASGVFDDTIEYFRETFVNNDKTHEKEWLIDKTEQFVKDMSLHNALRESVAIAQDDGKNGLSKTGIPDILKDALSVSFDNSIGHDYVNGVESRLEFYHADQHKLKFSLDVFNLITNGGIPNKSLTVFVGGPATGKSFIMTHLATDFMMDGKNVLYISMEMSEERIEERIDANILDIDISDLEGIDRDKYMQIANQKIRSSFGNMITKEYPTASAGASHFRYLLNELKLKKKFVPDVIFIDYLNICTSSRIKASANANSYTIIKSISEELRGLAIEFDVPIITATQTNRGGYRASDVDLTDISESFGIAMTADLSIAIISTEELDEVGQIGLKVIKNRYGPADVFHKLGRDFTKMRLYEPNTMNQGIATMTAQPSFNSGTPMGAQAMTTSENTNKKDKFGDFKI